MFYFMKFGIETDEEEMVHIISSFQYTGWFNLTKNL